jgi:hypothetical protein
LCGPRSDTRDFAQAAKKCVGINDSLKVDSACANRACESLPRLPRKTRENSNFRKIETANIQTEAVSPRT